jgi:hypothetical protein
MINILLGLLKGLLAMKFGWLIAIVIGVIIAGSIIKNVINGSFSVAKLASGFNPFTGSVQGKLIYYGVLALLAFGLYHQLTRATTNYDTDYKNKIDHNQDVMIDQRVGAKGCDVDLFYGLIKLGCNPKSITKTVNNNLDCDKCNATVPKKVK